MVLGGILLLWIILHVILHRPADQPYLIAHRGAAGLAPENTLAAISAGLGSGAARVEIDVQRTADGVLVLAHDGKLAGRRIGEYTYNDLQAAYASQEGGDARMATLDEALTLFAEYASPDTVLVVEGKDPSRYPGIAAEILAAIDAQGLRDRVLVVSFDQAWLREVHDLAPDLSLGSITVYPLIVPRADGTQMVALHWAAALADPTVVRRIHAQGYDAVIWTTDSRALARLLFWLGVDGVTTNRPDRLRQTP